MVAALPVDACAPLRNPASAVQGAIVLATVGRCGIAQQALNVAATGAAALMLVQSPPLSPVRPNPIDEDGNLVVTSLAISMIEWVS